MPRQPFDDFCEALSIVAADNGAGGRLEALAAWPPARWEPVIELASRHFVLPSIAARFTDGGVAATLDPELLAFFQEIHGGNVRRNRDLLEAAERCCALANRQGIRPMLLKGAAHLADEVYGNPGARYVADIDLLVVKDERDRLHHDLLEAGYRPLASDDKGAAFWADHHHAAPLLDPDGRFVVEIHSDTLREGGAIFGLDAPGVAARAVLRERHGAGFRLPCLEDRVVHCLAHNQVGHNARFVGAIEMRDLLDLHALTARAPCPEALWTRVLARFERAGHGDLAIGLLRALQAMVPEARLGPQPAAAGAAGRLRATRYLRRHRRSRLKDPTLYADLMRREWHRLGTLKAYRRQLWSHVGDLTYWYRRWRNLLDIIRRP